MDCRYVVKEGQERYDKQMRKLLHQFLVLIEWEERQNPLPMGKTEFDAWADRIIKGAAVPGLTRESALFSLTSMILHLPSTQSFATDSFFVHALRKAAAQQVAYTIMRELDDYKKARLAKEAQTSAATKSALKLVVPDELEKK
jgi:hypothetical protein